MKRITRLFYVFSLAMSTVSGPVSVIAEDDYSDSGDNSAVLERIEEEQVNAYQNTAAQSLEFSEYADYRISDEGIGYNMYSIGLYLTEYPEMELTISSSDPNVIATDGRSIFWPVGIGTAVLTVASADNPQNSASHEFEVYESVIPTGMSFVSHETNLRAGYAYPYLEAVYSPADAKTRTIWSSSNPSVIEVDTESRMDYQMITAKSAGTTVVRATSEANSSLTRSLSFRVTDNAADPGSYEVCGSYYQVDPETYDYTYMGDFTDHITLDPEKKYDISLEYTGSNLAPGEEMLKGLLDEFFQDNPWLGTPANPAVSSYYFEDTVTTSVYFCLYDIQGYGSGTLVVDDTVVTFETVGDSHWEEDSNGRRYVLADGTYATSQFVNVDGSVYYFNSRGYMVTGWQKISDQWYHFTADGSMNTGWLLDGKTWYYLDSEGVMLTGWQFINGVWYYFFNYGGMATGWQKVNGVWYYMNENGTMQTGWVRVNNTWYYMNQNGVMQTGWQTIGNAKYYLGSNGAMRTGWQLLWDSYSEVNLWYYFWPGGSQATGWVKLGSKWYYLNDYMYYYGYYYINGTKYWFKPNGEMVDGWFYYDGSDAMDGTEGFTGWVCCYSNGTGRTGWIPYGDDWYYAEEGDIYQGFYYIGGVFYAFDLNGKMYKNKFLYPFSFDRDEFNSSYPYHVDADGRGSNGWIRYNSTTEYYYQNGESHLRRISG